jgi:uracil-DNA glycosylase
MFIDEIPPDWGSELDLATLGPTLRNLDAFVAEERRAHEVYPAPGDVFAALRLTPYASVRAVILGHDPYHGPDQAHGLAFSVPDGVNRLPPSLRTIRAELADDLGLPLPESGSLERWARRGVLLLNTVLTVRGGVAGSHRRHHGRPHGWETFTDAVLLAVSEKPGPVVFLLWGRAAQAKIKLIDGDPHVVLTAPHPAARLAHGFRGFKPFSSANAALESRRVPAIDWSLADR